MRDLLDALERWRLGLDHVRERMYRAPTPQERERWHARWLLARGWSAAEVAEALARDPHTIGEGSLASATVAQRHWPSRTAAAPPRPDRRPAG